MQINFGARAVSCKIVYYGPGLSGKTTNIQKIHELMPGDRKGELTSIKTEGDRTLFFDFMSLDLGKIAGMDTRFQLYTVPGQVYYNATRKLVLQGADGIVFVADSGSDRMKENLESWQNLHDNLAEYGLSIDELPIVLQWNKRDLAATLSTDELNAKLNTVNAPAFEAVAVSGDGVIETLKSVCAMVCKTINARQAKAAASMGRTHSAAAESAAAPAAPAPPAPATPAAAPTPPPAPVQEAPATPKEELTFVSRRMRASQDVSDAATATVVAETGTDAKPAKPSFAPAAPQLEPRRLLATAQTVKGSGSLLVRALVAAAVLAAGGAVAAVLYALDIL